MTFGASNTTGGAYDLQVIWCWKETPSQMSKHGKQSVMGDPKDCWIKYDDTVNRAIEEAFQQQEGIGEYRPMKGYKIDFSAMTQTKQSSGFQRKIQRLVQTQERTSSTTTPAAIIWCWKESPSQMSRHAENSMYGDPSDCWIKYDLKATQILESAYTIQEGSGECTPIKGYVVNFSTMTQKKKATGFTRDVQRVDEPSAAAAAAAAAVAEAIEVPAESQETALPSRPQHQAHFFTTSAGNAAGAPTFSVDLLQLAKDHIKFLEFVHQTGVTTQQVTPESLRRYRQLWLPLVALSYEDKQMKKSKEALIPPPDIAWLWHCHRLAPSSYHRFIEQEFVKYKHQQQDRSRTSPTILDMQDPKMPYATKTNSFTKKAWKKQYPNEPFLLASNGKVTSAIGGTAGGYVNGFDLFASAKSQAGFLYQVERIPIQSRLVEEYRKFLQLLRGPVQPFQFVPTMEIDLMWHTHMTGASPAIYKQDCINICGKLFDHDDSLGEDRSQGGLLDRSFRQTGKLWEKTYRDPMYIVRGGYRGEAPGHFYNCTAGDSATKVTVDDPKLVPNSAAASPAIPVTPVSTIAVPVPSDQVQDDDATWSGSKKKCTLCAAIVFAAGIALFALTLAVGNTQIEYACGRQPPSAEEIHARGVPSCMQNDAENGYFCLRAGEDMNDPPVWCYENVVGEGTYYLWWSPCTKCRTAWRMHEERDDDKSRYKLATSQQRPGPSDMPPQTSDEWLEWDVEGRFWFNRSISFSDCPGSIDNDGISSSCFVETEKSAGGFFFLGILMAIISGITLCCLHCPTRSCGRGGATSHSGGGGCGGGGGGCGGGGGGCGGC